MSSFRIFSDNFVLFRQTNNTAFFPLSGSCFADGLWWLAYCLTGLSGQRQRLHWVAWFSFLSHLLWAFSHVYLYHFRPLMRIGWAHWCFRGLGARCPHASQWSLLAAAIGLFLPFSSTLSASYCHPWKWLTSGLVCFSGSLSLSPSPRLIFFFSSTTSRYCLNS